MWWNAGGWVEMLFWESACTDVNFSNLGLKCYSWRLYECGQQMFSFQIWGGNQQGQSLFTWKAQKSVFTRYTVLFKRARNILLETKMNYFFIPFLVVVVVVTVVVVGQKPARIGDDGKPLLNRSYIQRHKQIVTS